VDRPPKIALGLIVAAVCAGVGIGASVVLNAFNPQPDPPGFGMVGIAAGQTARLNVVNLGNGPPAVPPPCRASLQFFDDPGNLLANQQVRVEAGNAVFLDLAANFPPANGVGEVLAPPRAEIRAATETPDGELPPPCTATLEIFDNASGRTAVSFPPPCRTMRRAAISKTVTDASPDDRRQS